MQVWGLTQTQLESVIKPMGLHLENVTVKQLVNGWFNNPMVKFRLVPDKALRLAQHYVQNGKGTRGARNHVKACCYHEFKASIIAWFNLGATKMRTTNPYLHARITYTEDTFRLALADFYRANVGSIIYPVYYWQLCADRHSQEGV